MIFFGNKENFGIEIKLEENSDSFAYILIYVSNIYIGTLDDVTYLGSFLASLENNFCNVPKLPLRLMGALPKDIFLERFCIDEHHDDIDSFNIILEDTFDPFSMMIYKINSKEVILSWSLWNTDFRDKDYPMGIHSKKIDYLFLKKTIDQCINYFDDLLSSPAIMLRIKAIN